MSLKRPPPPHLRRVPGDGQEAADGAGPAAERGHGLEPFPARAPLAPIVKSVALTLGALAVLAAMVVIGLATVGNGARPRAPLLGPAAARPPVAVLTEEPRLALPPSAADNRFDAGWERHRGASDVAVLVPLPAAGNAAPRLLVVHLGEEVERTLILDLAPGVPGVAGIPRAAGRLRVRSGDRELATAPLGGAATRLLIRLPADLPVGQVPLDLIFEMPEGGSPAGAAGSPASAAGSPPAAAGSPASAAESSPAAGGSPAAPGLAFVGGTIAPVLPAGSARVEGQDLVQGGNCLVYLPCRLTGDEALVGTFVPPAGARPGQRFELAVERLDGTPIRRFSWQPSFWNRLRGARRFELPLRGSQGDVRVRLIARAGPEGGPAGRWQGLGLASVSGEILTPGQGQ
jgi:hypothetical protein